jgi:DNA-binding NarL/FixJ family response regulator
MKLLLAEDHVVARLGVRRLLSTITGIDIQEAATAAGALAAFQSARFDVVILDIALGSSSGFDVLAEIRAIDPEARVVVFTMHTSLLHVTRAISLGAFGYVSKSAPADELAIAVRHALEGRQYIERDIAMRILATDRGAPSLSRLSPRETEVLCLLGDGKSLAEIAAAMGVAYKTVSNTCASMKVKLGAVHTTELIRIAMSLR